MVGFKTLLAALLVLNTSPMHQLVLNTSLINQQTTTNPLAILLQTLLTLVKTTTHLLYLLLMSLMSQSMVVMMVKLQLMVRLLLMVRQLLMVMLPPMVMLPQMTRPNPAHTMKSPKQTQLMILLQIMLLLQMMQLQTTPRSIKKKTVQSKTTSIILSAITAAMKTL